VFFFLYRSVWSSNKYELRVSMALYVIYMGLCLSVFLNSKSLMSDQKYFIKKYLNSQWCFLFILNFKFKLVNNNQRQIWEFKKILHFKNMLSTFIFVQLKTKLKLGIFFDPFHLDCLVPFHYSVTCVKILSVIS